MDIATDYISPIDFSEPKVCFVFRNSIRQREIICERAYVNDVPAVAALEAPAAHAAELTRRRQREISRPLECPLSVEDPDLAVEFVVDLYPPEAGAEYPEPRCVREPWLRSLRYLRLKRALGYPLLPADADACAALAVPPEPGAARYALAAVAVLFGGPEFAANAGLRAFAAAQQALADVPPPLPPAAGLAEDAFLRAAGPRAELVAGDGRVLRAFECGAPVTALALVDGGEFIAGTTSELQRWSFVGAAPLARRPLQGSSATALCLSRDRELLFAAFSSFAIAVLTFPELETVSTLPRAPIVRALALCPAGFVALGDSETLVCRPNFRVAPRSLPTGAGTAVPAVEAATGRLYAPLPENRIAAWETERVLPSWQIQRGSARFELAPEDPPRHATAIAAHPDGRHFLCVYTDGTAALFRRTDPATEEVFVQQLELAPPRPARFAQIVFLPSGTRFAALTEAGACELWSLEPAACRLLARADGRCSSLAACRVPRD